MQRKITCLKKEIRTKKEMLNETDLYHASISRNLGFDVGIKAGMLIFLFKPFSLQTRENKRETSVQSKI